MVEHAGSIDLNLSPELISDLSSLADLPGKSLAQAGIDPEGAADHLEFARRRAAAVSGLLTAVDFARRIKPAADTDEPAVTDLGTRISQTEAGVRERIGDLPWELLIQKPTGARVGLAAEILQVLLDSMLSMALIWFPNGGAVSLHASDEGDLTWIRMEYAPGHDSPPLVDGLKMTKATSKSKASGEPAGMVAMRYLTEACGAKVEYELVKSDKARLSVGVPSASPIPRARRGARILVVDDDPDSAFMLEQAVGKAGYATVTAYDGLAALSKARDDSVILVLLDVMLPGMDGYEVLRRLRAEPPTADLPIVMVSAKSRPEDIETGLRLGASEYLTKPLRLADVVESVRKLVGEPAEE